MMDTYTKTKGGIALLTGKINNMIVIDIDDVNQWNDYLGKNKFMIPCELIFFVPI